MKTIFVVLAAAFVTLCSTSTALAETPAPAPGDAPQLAIFEIPQFYYSETRANARPPQIITNLRDVLAFEGDNVCFEMTFEGGVIPDLFVYFNGQKITSNHRYEMKLDPCVFLLFIRNVRIEDSGTYSVDVINRLGQVRTSATLVVQTRE